MDGRFRIGTNTTKKKKYILNNKSPILGALLLLHALNVVNLGLKGEIRPPTLKTMLQTKFALLILITSFFTSLNLTAQEVDPYDEYSHLWAEKDKKKKSKKKKSKDTPNIQLDSLKQAPVDSSRLLQTSDSLETNTSQPETVVYDSIPEPTEQFVAAEEETLDDTYEAEETTIEEEPLEEPKKEIKADTGPPVQDFRSGLEVGKNKGNFTGGLTYTQIGDESFVGLVLSPEFKIGKVGLGLNIPVLYGLDSKSLRTEIFKDGSGPARLIRYIRYGEQKKDPVYIKVGQLQNTMLGYGGLINNYTNSTSFEKRKVGLHYDINIKGVAGIEGLYSDFDPASLNLFAIRPYTRPLANSGIPIVKTFEAGLIYITDKDQTAIPTSDSTSTSYVFTRDGISAFGFDMGVTVFRVPFIQIDLFANYSKLNVESDTLSQVATILTGDTDFNSGSGFSAGVNFRMHFIADVFSTDIRIERLAYQNGYIPQFFDANYELNKDLRILSLTSATKTNGIYGSLTGHVLQKVILGGSLLIPDEITETSPAVVQVRADMERLADKFSLHGSYIKGNLTDLGDAFTFDERSLAKMRFIYHMNDFLAAGVDYYWAFTPVADGSYQATKYVMPYFGVSIDF